jgi:hypothetical protein
LKKIPLTKGAEAIVDDEDYPILIKHKWQLSTAGYAMGYLRRKGKDTSIHMHRVILGALPDQGVDHINGNKLDNRKSNLRFATQSQNCFNKGKRPNNTSGYKGVSLDRKRGTYRAVICANRKMFFLGRFKTGVEAAEAYNEAAKRLHGEFARLNEIKR